MTDEPGSVIDAAPARVRILPLAALDEVANGTAWLRFEAPADAACEPGQFFMLGPAAPANAVLLGRPFSIGDAYDDRWHFLLRALGRGTAWLGARPVGTPLRLVGPLGRPFRMAERPVHRLVAGGIGLAPFFYLARRLRTEQPAARIELFYGERTAGAHVPVEDGALFDAVERFTDDGSVGTAGSVLGGLPDDGAAAWYACGPQGMLRALAAHLEAAGVTGAQFSLEERMACGFGVCQACIVPMREAPPRYRLLCLDGPVMDPRTVQW